MPDDPIRFDDGSCVWIFLALYLVIIAGLMMGGML